MVDSGNPSGVLGDSERDSVQQSSVSENSESRTGPPPVNDPHLLAFQTVLNIPGDTGIEHARRQSVTTRSATSLRDGTGTP